MSVVRSGCGAALASLLLTTSAAAFQACLPNWTPAFGERGGTSGAASALDVIDLPGPQPPLLYVGGSISVVGATTAANSAVWNGVLWLDPTPNLPSGAQAFVVHDDGSGPTVYCGGSFFTSNSSGETIRRIVRWENGDWRQVGAGLGNIVYALGVYDFGSGPELVAGGVFTGPTSYLARWDGSAWLPLSPPHGAVKTISVHDDGSGSKLYIAQSSQNFVSCWSAAQGAWADLGGVFNGAVSALAWFDDGSGEKLHVGGSFTFVDGTAISGVAKWTGQSWAPVGGAIGAAVTSLCVFDDGQGPRLYAGGTGTVSGGPWFGGVAKFNGAAWEPVGDLAPGFAVRKLTTYDALDGVGPKLYAGGTNANIGDVSGGALIAWDGVRWEAQGRGLNGTVYAAQTFDDTGAGVASLFVGGGFSAIAGEPADRVARWDGSHWNDMDGGVSGVTAPSVRGFELFDDGAAGTQLYACGEFSTAGSVSALNVARWDGAHWNAVGAGVGGVVYGLRVFDSGSGDELYAAGALAPTIGSPLVRWNGSTWTAIPGFSATDTIRDMTVFDAGAGPELVVAGAFPSVSGVQTPNVARWDGAVWRAVGLGTDGEVYSVCVHDDGAGSSLFAAGKFTLAGGVSAARAARWNGVGWFALGAGLSDDAYAIESFDDGSGAKLYVGGRFLSAGATSAARIARWDGSAWFAMGAGIPAGEVDSLNVHDDAVAGGVTLIVGGSFRQSPAHDSFIAKWGCDVNSVVSYCTAMTSSAGCVAALSGAGAPSIGAPSGFVLTASGVDGQRNGLFFYGFNGRAATPWGPGGVGFLCVKTPVQRLGLTNSGGSSGACDGVLASDWSTFVANQPDAFGRPFYVGERLNAQAWYRDSAQVGGSNLTDALEFAMQP